MNEEQKKALAVVLEYLREERDDYEVYVEHGGQPDNHVYHYVMVLGKLLKGE